MTGSSSPSTTSTPKSNVNKNNLTNKQQDNDKYTAKRNDGKENPKNKDNKDKSSTSTGSTPQKEKTQGNSNQNNKKTNDQSKSNPKDQVQQKAKEQAAATAMTALGVPAPIAKALAKPVANKLDQKGMLPEAQMIKQGQERLNNMRKAIASDEDQDDEENEATSLTKQNEDLEANNVDGKAKIKFLQSIPKPIWIMVGGGLALLLFLLILFITIFSSNILTQIMHSISNSITVNLNLSGGGSSNSTVQGDGVAKGTLVLPVDSSSGYSWTNTSLYYSSRRYHGGNDISVATGTSVFAMDGGTVVSADTTTNKSNSCSSGYNSEGYCSFGKFIGIKHEIEGKTYYSVYAHLSSISVNVGDKVTQGQEIGKSGNTGNSTGPHLHIAFAYNYYGTTGAPVYNRGIITPYTYISGSKKGQSYVGDVGRNY